MFAASACISASMRDKDDYKNAAIGGALAGTVFGFASKIFKSMLLLLLLLLLF